MQTMRFSLCRLVVLITIVLMTGIAWAHMYTVNVKDFLARGDGVTDDTLAIQDAIYNAEAMAISEPSVNAGYHFTAPVVYFPHGKYRVTDSLSIGNINLVGEGNAIIQMTADNDPSVLDLTTDIVIGTQVWRTSISGFTFYGGRHQLYIGNPNTDTGDIRITNCDFYSAGGVAIHTRPGTPSTKLTIRDCDFYGCDQVLINYCDQGRMSDCWIMTSPTMLNKAVIENRNTLLLERILGVPRVTANNDQRWIDNYSVVTCRSVRFGGEDAGMTAVVNFAPYQYQYPVIPSSVILDDCDVYAAGNPKRKCAVYLEEVPNLLTIKSCRGFTDASPVRWSANINFNTYFDNANSAPHMLRYEVSVCNDIFPWGQDLPEEMRPFQSGEIWGYAQPMRGQWRRGQFVRNRNIAAWYEWVPNATPPDYGAWTSYTNPYADARQAPYGWLCTGDGKPGTWAPIWYKY
jgi:hypothetical protein